MTGHPAVLPVVVLISGNGSNLQAIIDAIARGNVHAEIRAVISNRPDAFGLERARRAGIPAEAVDHRRYTGREAFDSALQEAIDAYRPALVVLAGFMRILTPAFVQRYRGRLLNVHPSLLPEFRGLHTHRRALAAGVRRHGVSIHFVTDELDGGPVVIQKAIPVLPDDDETRLAARVQAEEHRLYPRVIGWFAAGRLKLSDDNYVIFDGEVRTGPLPGDTA
jgi:phosphoribosylglycinamide formyltransferase-1